MVLNKLQKIIIYIIDEIKIKLRFGYSYGQ